jgi:thymidylate synthase
MILDPSYKTIDPKDPKAFNLQYQQLLQRMHTEGQWQYYDRVDQECLVLSNVTQFYPVDMQEIKPGVYKVRVPADTTRFTYIKTAIMESLGYTHGLDNAADFRDFKVNTWNANANENKSWLNNPHRKGEDDMGRVYGVQARGWKTPEGNEIDQVAKIIDHLTNKYDDRGEIINMYNVGEFHLGCLRPCLYNFQYTLLGSLLDIMATQRSCDLLLGGNFNPIQVVMWNVLYALATKNKPRGCKHDIANLHIYKNQYEIFVESGHAFREVYNDPYVIIDTTLPNTAGKTGLDFLLSLRPENFEVVEYEHHDNIVYPMTA